MRQKMIEKRKKLGLTQDSISKLLGIARPTYNAYELGTINIPLDKAILIKKILKYSKDDIFFNS